MGGITRITEGDVKYTATGMNLSANDGDFKFNSKSEIQYKSDKVIEHNDYKAPHKEDVMSTGINVKLNIFFDGTGNNKTNTAARENANSEDHKIYEGIEKHKKDSFENGITNVARMFNSVDPKADNQVRVYVEGIGTKDLKEDTQFPGVAIGKGDTGVEAKVTKGCMDAAEMLYKKKYHKLAIDFLFVNVYGFSRGAAAARHFLHVASKMAEYTFQQTVDEKISKYYIRPDYTFNDIKIQQVHGFELQIENTNFIDTYGYFGACLLKNQIKPKKIIFNFVGLYDTVASFGIGHGTDTSDLKLDSITKARFVYHLASDDEYRDNFPLTNINSCGLRGIEFILPGVHSDIGGSYLNNDEEMSAIANVGAWDGKESRRKVELSRDQEFDTFKKIVVNEGWFTDKQINKEFFYQEDVNLLTLGLTYRNKYNYGLVGRRKLSNSYDKIPLQLMIKQSENFLVVYDVDLLATYAIKDEFIDHIKNCLSRYINEGVNKHNKFGEIFTTDQNDFVGLSKTYNTELKQLYYQDYITIDDLKKLRNKYLHWSVKCSLTGLGPKVAGAVPQELRKRHTYDG